MIRFAQKSDMLQIIDIWQDSFGDSKEEIEQFFIQCAESLRVCVYMEDNKVAGFLCLLSATLFLKDETEHQISSDSVEYIYAVATKKEFRNKGISTELLEYVKTILSEEHKSGILVPADEGLEQFYKKRGYICCFEKENIQVIHTEADLRAQSKSIPITCLREITVQEYISLRKKALQNISHLSLADKVVAYAIQSILSEGFRLSSISIGDKEYAFLYWLKPEEPNAIFIQETTAIGNEEIDFTVNTLLDLLGKTKAEVRISYPAYGILLPTDPPYEGCFNLVLD